VQHTPAIVLAAGLSSRMGRFKLTLPWGETTVLGQVLATLAAAGVGEAIVVTGHRAAEVEAAARAAIRGLKPLLRATTVHNPAYETGMLSSIQAGLRAAEDEAAAGLRAAKDEAAAALLCLGDQPQLEADTVRAVWAAGSQANWQRVIIPSYKMRAGHPILLPRALWPAVLAARDSLRSVLAAHRAAVDYLVVDTPSVLADLDTPEDYERATRREDTFS
jgi:molybdenum cofactor cytidylyltransferase